MKKVVTKPTKLYTGTVTEKHTCINWETGEHAYVLVVMPEDVHREDWILVSKRLFNRASAEWTPRRCWTVLKYGKGRKPELCKDEVVT